MRRIFPQKIGAFKSVFFQDLAQRLHEQIAALWRKEREKKGLNYVKNRSKWRVIGALLFNTSVCFVLTGVRSGEGRPRAPARTQTIGQI